MSRDAHPNINAVKTMLDVTQVVMSNLRGPAETKKRNLEFKILDMSRRFAIEVSQLLDDEVGVTTNQEEN